MLVSLALCCKNDAGVKVKVGVLDFYKFQCI